jgi:hypothetical protein
MSTLACSHCGAPAPADAVFCMRCGGRIAAPAAAVAPASVPAAAEAPASVPAAAPEPDAEPSAYRCICGTWNREGDAQCASCRRPLGQGAVRRPRPVQHVHTGPVHHPILRPDPVRERMDRDEEAGNTLGWVSVVCGVLSLLVFPVPLGVVAIACGIPAYLRGAKQGLVGMFIGLLGILLVIWAYR